MVLRSVSTLTYLLPAGLSVLGITVALNRRLEERYRRISMAVGWIILSGFWMGIAFDRLAASRPFLGGTALITGAICWYVATLGYRNHPPIDRITVAFLVMGATYVPFQFVKPIFRVVVSFVTASTSLGLAAMGYIATVQTGADGIPNVILVTTGPTQEPVAMGIASACTGISAIALFAGLIVAADCPLRRRLLGLFAFLPAIYVLNIVRNVFTIAAYREHTFELVASSSLATTFENSNQFSYFVAEQVIAPIYIVGGTVIAYRVLAVYYPSVEDAVETLVSAISADARSAITVLS
jgi:archaeosortase A (PGF-CTERM-specific)